MSKDLFDGADPYDQLVKLTKALAEVGYHLTELYADNENNLNLTRQVAETNRKLNDIIKNQTRVILGLKAHVDTLNNRVGVLEQTVTEQLKTELGNK